VLNFYIIIILYMILVKKKLVLSNQKLQKLMELKLFQKILKN